MPRGSARPCASTRSFRQSCRRLRSWSPRGTGPRITNGSRTSGWRSTAGGTRRKTTRAARPRDFDDPKGQMIYDVAKSLHEGHGLSQTLYDEAVKVLTLRGLVEVIGLCGYYTMVSMTLNTFEFGLPDGQVSELA